MPFRDQKLAAVHGIALRACRGGAPPKRGCIVLAIRENSAAKVTRSFGPHDHVVRATTATLGVPVFDAGYASPDLAPLFPARRPQASAPERATPWTFGNSCEDADTRRARCTMKPWLTVGEGAEYANVSRDTIYTACERGELRSARVSGRRAIRLRPAWIDAWLERHAPDVQANRRIGDARNGAAS